jgi:hypothetical protein
VTGERASQAGGSAPLERHGENRGWKRQNSPAPLAAFARRQSREAGAARPGTMRNRSEPGQVARTGFGSGRIAVTQRVNGCYCEPARSERLWRPFPKGQPKESPRKAGQRERSSREDHAGRASPVKIFRNAGDAKNGTAGL